MKWLEGQTAWITGGASGMGEGVCELFAEEGAKVAVVDIQADRGQQVAERIGQRGGEVIFIACDVTQDNRVRDAIDQTVERFGGLQIIVNCAGIVHVVMLHEYAESD